MQGLVIFAARLLGNRIPVDSLPLTNALAAQANFLTTVTAAGPAQMVWSMPPCQVCKLFSQGRPATNAVADQE